jgi:hypothetical protein
MKLHGRRKGAMQPGVQSDCSGGSLDHKHQTEISLEGGNAQIQDAGQVKSKPKGRYRAYCFCYGDKIGTQGQLERSEREAKAKVRGPH